VSELLAVYGRQGCKEILTLFITEMRGLLDDAYRGIERRDDVAVARIGHQIKDWLHLSFATTWSR